MSDQIIGVRELKARLSHYLRLVRQGQTIVITDRGKPVGFLSPMGVTLEDRLVALREAGLVDWVDQKLPAIAPVVTNDSDRQVADLLVAMRDE